ncbi:MAG: GNAT family N-acetyltransferase [Pseudohongiellaceae bacterium]
MNVMEIEEATRCAWPALEEVVLPFGVLRYANGADRRTNSLSLYPNAKSDAIDLIGVTERFYKQRNAVPIIRIVRSGRLLPTSLKAVDRALAFRGYEKQSPTVSMLLDLTRIDKNTLHAVSESIEVGELDSWLRGWYALTDKPLWGVDAHQSMLKRLEPAQLLLLNHVLGNTLLATGMGVLAGRSLGIFGIATAAKHRNQGHATAVVCSLLQWALHRAAGYAYLQVEESNEAAIDLYRKIGFRKRYSYWYRVATHNVEN